MCPFDTILWFSPVCAVTALAVLFSIESRAWNRKAAGWWWLTIHPEDVEKYGLRNRWKAHAHLPL